MTGFLNIDKAEGDTSTYVVNCVKRLSHEACGHLGTLDPLASGVLPVGIGNATRLFSYFLEKDKTYIARFRFGATSVTLDRESAPVFGGRIPSEEEIAAALPRFEGELLQTPPAFSAISVDGKRSYEYAREGTEVALSPRKVRIGSFRLLGRTERDEFSFEIVCGGGTYIRALARDLAEVLGTKGYMTGLTRTRSGCFTLENAVSLRELTPETLSRYLIPTEEVLPYPALTVEDERYYRGVRYAVSSPDGFYKIYRGGSFYGIGAVEGGVLRPEKKLC